MPKVTQPLSVGEFRKELSDALGTVIYGELGTRVEILNRGKPVGYLIGTETAHFLSTILRMATDKQYDGIAAFVENFPTK